MVAGLRQYMNAGSVCERCIRAGIVSVVAVAVVGVTGYLLVLNSQNIAWLLGRLSQGFTNLPTHIPKVFRPKA